MGENSSLKVNRLTNGDVGHGIILLKRRIFRIREGPELFCNKSFKHCTIPSRCHGRSISLPHSQRGKAPSRSVIKLSPLSYFTAVHVIDEGFQASNAANSACLRSS